MMVGTVKTLGSDFISSVNALSKKVKEPIPYVCNALLKANLTSHVSKDGRFPPLMCFVVLSCWCALQVHPPAGVPRERAECKQVAPRPGRGREAHGQGARAG